MMIIWTLLTLIAGLALFLVLYFAYAPRIGANPKGERLARIRSSSSYRDDRFQNPVETNMDMPMRVMRKVMWEMMKGGEGREPKGVVPTVPFDKRAWEAVPETSTALAWFGHSTLLIRTGGITLLTDPVFGERASTFAFAGPKRFRYEEHMNVDLLPHVDAVLLSHDHYDHLDHGTVRQLKGRKFIAPLGVGAHLEHWGVPASAITECDRWESVDLGELKLTLAPSRHFSGRNLNNRFSTLWGSWAIEGGNKRMYFGADSGYWPGFSEIGERLGPFDLALLECGAYNAHWANIHMMPEETAQAAVDLQAAVLMPIHWAKFSLALHPWKEPILRVSRKAEELGIPLFTPRIGAIVTDVDLVKSERWWEPLS